MKIISVYCITNKQNGKMYIGSSFNTKKRLNEHRRNLRLNQHINGRLQNSWNKYGEENFHFETILELPGHADDKLLRTWESVFIKAMKPQFNMNGVCASNFGYKHTAETRQKMREALLRRGPVSEQTRKLHSQHAKAQDLSYLHTKEMREKIGTTQRSNRLGKPCENATVQIIKGNTRTSKSAVVLTYRNENVTVMGLMKVIKILGSDFCTIKRGNILITDEMWQELKVHGVAI